MLFIIYLINSYLIFHSRITLKNLVSLFSYIMNVGTCWSDKVKTSDSLIFNVKEEYIYNGKSYSMK